MSICARVALFALLVSGDVCHAAEPPNIVYIMSDELAYFELSHMGNEKLHTPNIDKMARNGIRFTQALAAAPVCGPLRCALMTGKHMGHASVRVNDGGTPLRAEEATIASVLKQRGYATGGFGKWGAGGRGSTGVPEQHGFDTFFGYYDQVHAHSFYTPYLIRNSVEVPLAGNLGGREGETYSHYQIMREGLQFIRSNRERPFFCYFPVTPPHGMYDIPADDPAWKQYENDAWMHDPDVSQEAKNYAAMVTMVDNNLGEVLELLEELELTENTIVFFTGDNGGQDRFSSNDYPRGFFSPNVDPKTGREFRGQKNTLYEGGLRIPFLVSWPGKVQPAVSDLIFSQVDVFPTLAELAGAETPNDLDGMSILPTLLGQDVVGRQQQEHEFLYWEYGRQTAIRIGQWKGVRSEQDAAWELYDLASDISEAVDVSANHVDIVSRMQELAEREHSPVRPGTFSDRALQERDRAAKWGTAKQPVRNPTKVNTLGHKDLIPAETLKLVRFSSQNAGNDRLAKYAIDGQAETVWHSQFSPSLVRGPHELVIDLGATYRVTGVQYLTRQDAGWNGAFGKTHVTVSHTADAWPDPNLTVTFEKKRSPQTAELPRPAAGRYVRIQVIDSIAGGPWSSAADIGIMGTK